MKKRLFAFLMAIVLCLSFVPTAFAAETTSDAVGKVQSAISLNKSWYPRITSIGVVANGVKVRWTAAKCPSGCSYVVLRKSPGGAWKWLGTMNNNLYNSHRRYRSGRWEVLSAPRRFLLLENQWSKPGRLQNGGSLNERDLSHSLPGGAEM